MSNTAIAIAAARELTMLLLQYQTTIGTAVSQGREITDDELAALRTRDDEVRAEGQRLREQAQAEGR